MIKVLQRGHYFVKDLLKPTVSTVRISKNLYSSNNGKGEDNKNKQYQSRIENIKNVVKHLRIYDEIDLLPADLDWEYLLDKNNIKSIEENNKNRKGVGNIRQVHELYEKLQNYTKNPNDLNSKFAIEYDSEKIQDFMHLIEEIYKRASEIPNLTHETVPIGNHEQTECIQKSGKKIDKKTPTIDKISELFGWLKEKHIALYSTQRAYILKNELADLETALVRYTLDYLNSNNFTLVSVPDILHHSIIESCGFPTKGFRNQVYKLDHANEYGKYCLSGTSEMSLAGLLKNKVFNESELPLKLCAASRCFRAEVSGSEKEGKLYRLHEFTKIEMFVVTHGNLKSSNEMLEEILSHQINLYSDLGLHFQVLNMSTHELGSPAFKKYDIEAWMPGNQFYGEISSTSNCTDYQSRRLHIKSSNEKFKQDSPTTVVHTLNGTACAIPRMLTSIIESNWDMETNSVTIPEKLRPYMNNRKIIVVPKDFRQAESMNNSRHNKK